MDAFLDSETCRQMCGKIDDGSYENTIGLNNGNGGGNESFAAVWVNRFAATGPLTIDSSSIEWPSGTGIVPGSATSAELQIPNGSTSSSSPSATPSTAPPSADPTAAPTVAPSTRTTPSLTLTLLPKGQPRLKIRVHGKVGTSTGTVLVRGPRGWRVVRTLSNGRVVLRVPKALITKSARLVVRYRGDTHYLPVQRPIHLRRAAR